MSLLQARAVRVRRTGKTILDNVSLDVRAGDFIAVIGPNGAGKSTLLSVLAGLIAPESGTVTLDGTALAQMGRRALARRRAYLPQNPHVEWPLPVERLVALGLTPHLPALGALPAAWSGAVDAALAAFDLESRRDQPATTLSGGELARAMLARATVGSPDILIVDEPITGLDPKHAMRSMAHLAAYARQGRTVIASLHDLTLATRYADRIIALKDGRVAGEGPLTAALVRCVFEIESEIRGEDTQTTVDFRAP